MKSPIDAFVTGHLCLSAVVGSRWGRVSGQGGFALIFALMVLVAVSLAAAVAVQRAKLEAQRERETQLLWIGNQFRQSLRSYFSIAPQGGQSQYPLKLEDLVEDGRGLKTLHHLRQLYVDPFTGKADWAVEMDSGRIVGVHSRSTDAPVRHAGLGLGNAGFGVAKTYADWRFMAGDEIDLESAAPTAAPPPGPGLGNTSSLIPGSDTPSSLDPPVAPPDPNANARAQCNLQFGAPMLRCRGPDFPMGNDVLSCQRAEANALSQCLAAFTGSGGSN